MEAAKEQAGRLEEGSHCCAGGDAYVTRPTARYESKKHGGRFVGSRVLSRRASTQRAYLKSAILGKQLAEGRIDPPGELGVEEAQGWQRAFDGAGQRWLKKQRQVNGWWNGFRCVAIRW